MSVDNPQALAEQCADVLWKSDTATRSLNMIVEEIGVGSAVLGMTVDEKMSNGHGTCHGGYIFTLADSAFAFACNTYNQRSVAHQCSISYISPAYTGETLTAQASEISRQGRNGIYDVVVSKDDGSIVAQFRGHSRTIKGRIID